MIRILLTVVLPLVAPTLLYFLIVHLRAKWKKEDEASENIPAYHAWPWFRLIGAGSVLLIMTFLIFGFPKGENLDGIYVPPKVIDGEIVPGHYIKEADE